MNELLKMPLCYVIMALIFLIFFITGSSSVTVLQSTFVYPIAGVMYFKQVEGEEVQMWGRMYWVNGMNDTMYHNWHIHENNVSYLPIV